ncbi:MAG: metal-dependent hydrolase [Myxococcaceae bacterium]|nr:metal-dependent hydrolase [Myxococcaceae bacterium]
MQNAASVIPHQPRARRPSSVSIAARNIKFGVGPETPRYWVSDDPFLTHFMNALSVIFPPGERMFMEAVKAVRERVKNPETRADIAGFLAQEALHSREHSALNAELRKLGYPVRQMEEGMAEHMERVGKQRSKKTQLAATVALEHMTALLGYKLLSQEHVRALCDPGMLPIWMWHAVEELEHKAVAFDTYQEAFGDYLPRALALLTTTVGLFGTAHMFQYYLLKRDGLAHDPKLWAKGLWRLWGPKGLLTDMLPQWLEYFRPDFHPWQQDDSSLIEDYEQNHASAASTLRA